MCQRWSLVERVNKQIIHNQFFFHLLSARLKRALRGFGAKSDIRLRALALHACDGTNGGIRQDSEWSHESDAA